MADAPRMLRLYRQLMRAAGQFADYNFRAYAQRRVRDAYRAHRSEQSPARLAELVRDAETMLPVLRRQAWLNSQFRPGSLPIERPPR